VNEGSKKYSYIIVTSDNNESKYKQKTLIIKSAEDLNILLEKENIFYNSKSIIIGYSVEGGF